MPKPARAKEPKKSESITYTQSFAAVIQAGEKGKRLVVRSPRWYQYQLNKYRIGEQVTLQVHNRKPKRSLAQNAFYWGVFLPLVAEETGEKDLDMLHELFKGKFLTQGVVEVLGEKVRMKKSTTELSISEFTEFIMAIEGLTGVKAPPTESWGLEAPEPS